MPKMSLVTQLKRLFTLYVRCNKRQRTVARQMQQDYSKLPLSRVFEEGIETVKQHAQKINTESSESWNFYSNALRREVVKTFEVSLDTLVNEFPRIDYLEIGSAQGISMSFIGHMLKQKSALGKLVSIDPYFSNGYYEGGKGVWKTQRHVDITKEAKQRAEDLYRSLELNVELQETVSTEGLRRLHQQGRKFHIIYIDAAHEGLNPIVDFGMCCALLHPGGVLMLDDYLWPDVEIVKQVCDRYCFKLAECWKVAAYQVPAIINSTSLRKPEINPIFQLFPYRTEAFEDTLA